MSDRKLISVVTPCFNEEGNVEELHQRIVAQLEQFPQYDFEHIYIDNASTDGTVAAIRRLASADFSRTDRPALRRSLQQSERCL